MIFYQMFWYPWSILILAHCALRPSQGCLELGLWVTSFQNITFHHPPIVYLMNLYNKVTSNLVSATKKAVKLKHWRLMTLKEELLKDYKYLFKESFLEHPVYLICDIWWIWRTHIFSHTELKSIALDFNSNHPPLIYSHSHCSYSLFIV